MSNINKKRNYNELNNTAFNNNNAFDNAFDKPKKPKTGEESSPSKSNSAVTTWQAEAPQHSTPQSKPQQGGLLPVLKVKVTNDEEKGKYVLKIKKEEGSSDEVNRAEQMAESATKLLRQAKIIRGMGEQLLEIFQPSPLQSIFGKSVLELKYK